MSTISSAEYSNAGCVSCGTTAIRRATAARGSALISAPSSRTVPLSGRSTPASILSSVVLPGAVRSEDTDHRPAVDGEADAVAERADPERPPR